MVLASCTASTTVVSPGAAWVVSGARRAKKLATAVPAARVYGEIRTPWRHATIHVRAPYLPSERVGPTLAVAERIS